MAAVPGALGAADMDMAEALWEEAAIRATRTYTGLGNQTLGGHKQSLMCTRTQEKGAVTPARE